MPTGFTNISTRKEPDLVTLTIVRVQDSDPAVALPERATPHSAGLDLRANLEKDNRADGILLAPGERRLIPTGLKIDIPHGYEGQIRPRSGLAFKHGISILNSPGTIDSDYRGEVGILLINLGQKEFSIGHGDRIAQLVICKVESVTIVEAGTLSTTMRNEGGFGSTGS